VSLARSLWQSSSSRTRVSGTTWVTSGLILCGALTVASCGGNSPSATSSSTSTAPQATAPRPNVTAAPETNTPGDIPDTIAYVQYVNAVGGYRFDHPEGWAQTGQGTAVTFTDKLNGVSADVSSGAGPTTASAQSGSVPMLRTSQSAFELRSVSAATLPAGSGVLIVYRRNSAPDAVTGKSVRVEVQRYEILGHGHVVTLELFGAVGADNVDPYRKMNLSLALS
jgi:hypothetical protein